MPRPPRPGTDPGPPAAAPLRRRTGRPSHAEAQAGLDAGSALLQAAGAEFVEHGYGATTSNRIAQRAGFAPQTFYRWYDNKLAIFIEVYRAWAEAELAMLEGLLTEQTGARAIAEACVQSHRAFVQIKRSLRELAPAEPLVRAARAACRQAQIDRVAHWRPGLGRDETAALLVGIDHLCEALAEGEFDELGTGSEAAWAQLAGLVERLRPPAAR